MKTDLLCAISGYGMVTGASVLLAAFLLFFISKKRGLYEDFAFEALLFVIIPALLFARLYYVTFDFAANGTHWTAGMFFGVNTTNSSLSAFGAIIGGFLGICALYAFNRYLFDKDPDKYAYRNVTLSQLCDAAFVAAIFALGVGRWGDLIDNRSMGTIVGNDALKWFPMAVKTGTMQSFSTNFCGTLSPLRLCLRRTSERKRVMTGLFPACLCLCTGSAELRQTECEWVRYGLSKT